MDSIDILKFYLKLGEDIVSEKYLSSISYSFLDNVEFSKISDDYEQNRVFWNETLSRVHWASISTILRNNSWIRGILNSYTENNFLTIASNLRSFVEACGDSVTSLRIMPLTIANYFKQISDCVNGRKLDRFRVSEIENLLIHFHYARKLNKTERKSEAIPKSHEAEFAATYVEVLEDNNSNGSVKKLYSELCQFVHPAAHSVLYNMMSLEENDHTILKYNQNAEKTQMHDFLIEYRDTINGVCQDGYNNALVLLKLLNLFNKKEYKTPKLDSIELTNIDVWNKVVARIQKG